MQSTLLCTGRVCLRTAIEGTAQWVNSSASGTLLTSATIPSLCRWWRKRRAGVLKRPPCVGNDIRHRATREDLPVTFILSAPSPPCREPQEEAGPSVTLVWLYMGSRGLLRAQGCDPNVSTAGELRLTEEPGGCTAPVQRGEDKHTGRIRAADRVSRGHVGHRLAHFTLLKG